MVSLIYLFFLACTDSAVVESSSAAPVDLRSKVGVADVSKQLFSQDIRVSATIQARRTSVLVPRVPGRVSQVNVRIGDLVQEGEVLLNLEGGDYLAGFQEAKAAHELALLQAEQAQQHFNRFEALRKENAMRVNSGHQS